MVLAYISDHFRCRGLVSIVSGLLGVIGFAMFLGECCAVRRDGVGSQPVT